MTNKLRPELPPLTGRLSSLPIDDRGYPVPHFIALIDGQPDHRVVDTPKFMPALVNDTCWICNERLGKYKSFLIGPMCQITRTIGEPPSHKECLEYSVRACPFLSRPNMRRRDTDMPAIIEKHKAELQPGHIARNPGVMCIWTTLRFRPFKVGKSILIDLGDEPESMAYYREGRAATQSEVMDSINSGLPILIEQCRSEDDATELGNRVARETDRIRRHFELRGVTHT